MGYTNILFDLDGTLSDPKIGITKSIQYALAQFKIEVKNPDKLEPFIGPPLADSFKRFYSFSEDDTKKAIEYYREYFKKVGIYENKLYPGIIELLNLLSTKKRRIILATSKPTIFAEKILKYFKIERYFELVVGSNLDGTMVDKTEIIKYILKTQRLEKDKTIMIGDRKYDIIGAHNNGIHSIGVGYGFSGVGELKEAKPTYRVKTVQELTKFLS